MNLYLFHQEDYQITKLPNLLIAYLLFFLVSVTKKKSKYRIFTGDENL